MNERYADVVVDISHEKLDRSFQYRIPPELAGKIPGRKPGVDSFWKRKPAD